MEKSKEEKRDTKEQEEDFLQGAKPAPIPDDPEELTSACNGGCS